MEKTKKKYDKSKRKEVMDFMKHNPEMTRKDVAALFEIPANTISHWQSIRKKKPRQAKVVAESSASPEIHDIYKSKYEEALKKIDYLENLLKAMMPAVLGKF